MTPAELEHVARRRRVTAAELRRILMRPPGHCTWCALPVPRGRRTWCGDACLAEYRIRFDGQFIRAQVRKRDRGICSACGVDCPLVVRLLRQLRQFSGFHAFRRVPAGCTCMHCLLSQQYPVQGYNYWEADHIIPVIEGGSRFGLENYRTLCLVCHRKHSALLAARLATARRGRGPTA